MGARRLGEETGPVSGLEQIRAILEMYDYIARGDRSRAGEELWGWYEAHKGGKEAGTPDLTVFRRRAVKLLSDSLRRRWLEPWEMTDEALEVLSRTAEKLDAAAVAGGDADLEALLRTELEELREMVAVQRGPSWAAVVEARAGRR